MEGNLAERSGLRRVQEEYARLRTAFESLQGVLREMGGNRQESVPMSYQEDINDTEDLLRTFTSEGQELLDEWNLV